MLFCAILLVPLLSSVEGAVNGCPAATPCVCDGAIINCVGHKLSAIPIFTSIPNRYSILKLSDNNIRAIPASAFASLNVTTVELDKNEISQMDDNAFAGIQSSLTRLNLAHNKLTQLPDAIKTLTKLSDLDVTWNPISQYKHHHSPDGLTDHIMRAIGISISKFAFGDSSFITWPTTLDHLNQLRELRVSGSNLSYWPSNCFHGFEHTLKKLTIEYAALASIPIGIAMLDSLEELHLDHLNVNGLYGVSPFGDDSMIQAPFEPISNTLKILSLNYDGLTTFPEVIHDLKNLHNLSLDGNNLEFISDEAIRLLVTSNVTHLSLKDCNLKRVPGAISDLTNLMHLDVSNNKIRSIESTDLQHLNKLNSLSLSQNPLKYFSNNSLCGMNNLRVLNLFNTSLTELSRSFQNLKMLQNLDLRESKIDCTCDITWIAQWKQLCKSNTTLEIQGQCETIDKSIMDYIDARLPECLDYKYSSGFRCDTGCTKKRGV